MLFVLTNLALRSKWEKYTLQWNPVNTGTKGTCHSSVIETGTTMDSFEKVCGFTLRLSQVD